MTTGSNNTDLNCKPCDGTGRQTIRTDLGIYRYPVSCGHCRGTGVSETALEEAIAFLVDGGKMTDTKGYNTLLRAARALLRVKR